MPEPPYRPLDAQVISRFAGIRTFMRAPHVTELDDEWRTAARSNRTVAALTWPARLRYGY